VSIVGAPLTNLADSLANQGHLDGVVQIRATVAGDPDAPETVEVLVLSDGSAVGASARDALDDWWLQAHDAATATTPSFHLLPVRYELITELSAAELLRSVLLNDYRLR
jgi:hypothetical protein